jgi:carotenoid 1,2-hydratase
MPETVNRRGPPPFDTAVPRDGYRWWYLDAVSDDGKHALVVIAFVGSVFSPYYFHARQRGHGRPENHCAINVALYGPGGRWCMTERGEAALTRESDRFRVGPSRMTWDGQRLEYELDERCAPFGQPLRGRIRAWPRSRCELAPVLDPGGRHQWIPWSPLADVEVELEAPRLRWKGRAYLDANAGGEPLEQAFRTWDWSRRDVGGGTRLHYELRYPDGRERLLCYQVEADGSFSEAAPAPAQRQRLTGWGIRRCPRLDHPIERIQTLEDTPFYARSLFAGAGVDEHTVHERLDMTRFVSTWVRMLLPFRMPRRRG